MNTQRQSVRRGIALIMAMVFIVIFAAVSIGFLSLSSANTQTADNHRIGNNALNAALSGLDCARYAIETVSKNNIASKAVKATVNNLTPEQAEASWYNPMWTALCNQLKAVNYGSTVSGPNTSTVDGKTQYKIFTSNITYDNNSRFSITFSRFQNDPNILVQITGVNGTLNRKIQMTVKILPDSSILNYALAGRGRIWLAGDTTIHGSVYSSYGYKSNGTLQSMAPFNMTSDSTVEGSFNTILPWQKLEDLDPYQLQTFEHNASGNLILDDSKSIDSSGYLINQGGNYIRDKNDNYVDIYANQFNSDNGQYTVIDSVGNPIEGFVRDAGGNLVSIGAITYGNPIEAFDADNERIYSSSDELLGTYENTNYNQPNQSNIPGLNIGDYYDASGNSLTAMLYKSAIPTTAAATSGSLIQNGVLSKPLGSTVTEYFPHASGSYTTAASSSSQKLTRYKYENKTIQNVVVSGGTHALFKGCTFEGILYIDCSTSGPTSTNSTFNNVRFENCTFNGTIITNVPNALNTNWWMKNCLYFTGEAAFNNNSTVKEATILAPHFNVNLGNTNPTQSDSNVLTGAIIGGIVDVRGNAQIYGTIVSMADTSSYTSGYVSNIGATENDGGSETTEAGDIGTIEITPDPGNLLPSGITTPIVLKPQAQTYQEYL